jgi:hypothetical protein
VICNARTVASLLDASAIVSGRTTITQDRQSHSPESRCSTEWRHRYVGALPRVPESASCRRRTRFSAWIDRRDQTVRTSKPIKSATRRNHAGDSDHAYIMPWLL